MLFNLKTTNKHLVLMTGVHGVALNKGLGNIVKNNVVSNEKREIDRNTLIKIIAFNFQTNKVRIECTKDLNNYQVEVGFKYILDKCVLEQVEALKPVDAVFVKYYIQNVLDKETALFILVMILTYICGLFIGKVF